MSTHLEVLSDIWAQLAPIGRRGPGGGYDRFTFSPAHREAEAVFTASAVRLGLAVERDRNGNLWAWWEGPWGDRTSAGQLVTGSHLDSVPDGGAFDGPLGIASAFAAIASMQRAGKVPARTIGVVAFIEEEGARFGVACAGSRLLTGELTPERARELRDAAGTSWAEAMREAGGDPDGLGPDPERLARIAAFVELHIEQGHAPVAGRPGVDGLSAAGSAIGLGTHIWPHGRWRLVIEGRADHAGTTPLRRRDDALLLASGFVRDVREAAEAAGALATVGRMLVEPNGTNAVPARVTAWLDARGDSEEHVQRVLDSLTARGWDGLSPESWTPAVRFDDGLLDACGDALAEPPRLGTGAGHDAGILSLAGIPTAMLFVRNPTGTSHSPAEHAETADCGAGVEALATILATEARFGQVSRT